MKKTTPAFTILHRTGGVYSTFIGTVKEAYEECDEINSKDECGTTVVHAFFTTREECLAALERLEPR